MSLAELNPECHQYLSLQKNLFLDSTSRGHQYSFPISSSNFINFFIKFHHFFSNFHHLKMFPLVCGFTYLSYPIFLVWEVLMFCWAYVKIPGSSLQVKILCWIVPAKLLSHKGTITMLWGAAPQRTMEGQGRCSAYTAVPCWNGADAHDQPHSYWTLLTQWFLSYPCTSTVSMGQKFPIGICSWWSRALLSLPVPGWCGWLPRGWYQKTGTCLSAGLTPC